jgi:hypothetical protein
MNSNNDNGIGGNTSDNNSGTYEQRTNNRNNSDSGSGGNPNNRNRNTNGGIRFKWANDKILTIGTQQEHTNKDQYVQFKNTLEQYMTTEFKEAADFVPSIMNLKDPLQVLVRNSRPSKTKLKNEMGYTQTELNAMSKAINEMFSQETKTFTAQKITIWQNKTKLWSLVFGNYTPVLQD